MKIDMALLRFAPGPRRRPAVRALIPVIDQGSQNIRLHASIERILCGSSNLQKYFRAMIGCRASKKMPVGQISKNLSSPPRKKYSA
jgi:hypothetical protein